MRRQGIVWYSAVVAVLGTAACFTDPSKSLQGTPSRLLITEVSVTGSHSPQTVGTLTFASLAVNDTAILGIQVLDKQGNYFSFSTPTLATSNAAVANLVAYPDTVAGVLPGNTYYKALLIATGAGSAVARITAAGVTDSVVVAVQ